MRRTLRHLAWNFLYGAIFGVAVVFGAEVLRGRLTRAFINIMVGPGRWRRLISYFTLEEKRR